MTENNPIKGYRTLSPLELELINEAKELEKQVLAFANKLRTMPYIPTEESPDYIDGRWASIGLTHIEQGFMALIRSIAKPKPL